MNDAVARAIESRYKELVQKRKYAQAMMDIAMKDGDEKAEEVWMNQNLDNMHACHEIRHVLKLLGYKEMAERLDNYWD